MAPAATRARASWTAICVARRWAPIHRDRSVASASRAAASIVRSAVEPQRQGLGLGTRLLARALADAWGAAQTLPFVGVILDALDPATLAFYQRFDFQPLPGHPKRLFLPFARLDAMMRDEA